MKPMHPLVALLFLFFWLSMIIRFVIWLFCKMVPPISRKSMAESFRNMFMPQWRSSDLSKKRKAIETLKNPRLLAKIATNNDDEFAQVYALRNPHLVNQALLFAIALKDGDEEVRAAAVTNMNRDFAAKTSQNANNKTVKWAAEARLVTLLKDEVRKLTDQASIARIAIAQGDFEVRALAIEKLTDQTILADIATSEDYVGAKAVNNPHFIDRNLLAMVVERGHGFAQKSAFFKLYSRTPLETQLRALQIRSGLKQDDFSTGCSLEKIKEIIREYIGKYQVFTIDNSVDDYSSAFEKLKGGRSWQNFDRFFTQELHPTEITYNRYYGHDMTGWLDVIRARESEFVFLMKEPDRW